MNTTINEARIEADTELPLIHIYRDFHATPEQLLRCHTDSKLFARWVGPSSLSTRIEYWDAKTGGAWRYVSTRDGQEFAFHGCFHEVNPGRIVQTFTFEGAPDAVALETMEFTDLGNGMTRLHGKSLCDSFATRDAMLSSGMDVGINEGYAKLDEVLSHGLA